MTRFVPAESGRAPRCTSSELSPAVRTLAAPLMGHCASGLRLPPQRDRVIRMRIGEASYAAALDLTGAAQPRDVLLHAQFGCSRAVHRLGQFQRGAATCVLDDIEKNVNLGQFRPAPGPSSRCS